MAGSSKGSGRPDGHPGLSFATGERITIRKTHADPRKNLWLKAYKAIRQPFISDLFCNKQERSFAFTIMHNSLYYHGDSSYHENDLIRNLGEFLVNLSRPISEKATQRVGRNQTIWPPVYTRPDCRPSSASVDNRETGEWSGSRQVVWISLAGEMGILSRQAAAA